MSANPPTSTSELVVEFIAERLRISADRLKPTSRLNHDRESMGTTLTSSLLPFLRNFVFAPKVSPTPNTSDLRDPVRWFFPKRRLVPITVEDLIKSASAGKWQIRAKIETAPKD